MAILVRRIFDLNAEAVPCPADLDVNGVVDLLDVARLAVNLGMYTGATLYHGDLDFDDDVDAIDYLLLIASLGSPCSEAP